MTKSLDTRLTQLEGVLVAEDSSADPVAVESWARLVDWAYAVREVGGYESALALVTSAKSFDGLPEALTIHLQWAMSVCFYRVGGQYVSDDLYSWVPLALADWIGELIDRGVPPHEIKQSPMMHFFYKAIYDAGNTTKKTGSGHRPA